ncbi:hypothetical protein [Enterovibrio baiacu]|uniref:hypothetical protein n=1 Tax=Enterovibrio baiacu TaxID=2491023 RepID=UPI0010131EE8|nr:hypothetical protein [Enterovibrio baiacu]MBE1275672.1 hypothetical protein [Enterovibrio baiacu]
MVKVYQQLDWGRDFTCLGEKYYFVLARDHPLSCRMFRIIIKREFTLAYSSSARYVSLSTLAPPTLGM